MDMKLYITFLLLLLLLLLLYLSEELDIGESACIDDVADGDVEERVSSQFLHRPLLLLQLLLLLLLHLLLLYELLWCFHGQHT